MIYLFTASYSENFHDTKKGKTTDSTRRDSAWQKFEELVAQIEKRLAPEAATVTLNDKVPDLVTGDLRQVDATIRYKIGSIDILIAIECRHRKSKQHIMWIEQLKAKRENIGANQIVGVSSEGYTEPALAKAKQYGITLRRLGKIDVGKFIERFIVEVKYMRHKHIGTKFDFNTSDPKVIEYLNHLINCPDVENNKKPFLWFTDLNKMLTLGELVDVFYHKSMGSLGQVADIEHDHDSFEIQVPNGHMYVSTPFGNIFLKRFMLEFDYREKKSTINRPTEFIYEDEAKNEISRVYEFKSEDLDGRDRYFHHIEHK